MKDRSVQEWFDMATAKIFAKRYEAGSGFQSTSSQTYISLGAFGTGLNFIDSNPEKPGSLRYAPSFIGDVIIDANHQGVIDTVYRRFWLTARNAVAKFGVENVGERIVKCLERGDKDADKDFEFVHCVMPNPNHDPESIDPDKMAYLSAYIEVADRKYVRKSGYRTMPYAVARYELDPYSHYGRSPAMQVLPYIRTLNEMARVDLRASHLAIQPPVLAYDDGIVSTIDMRPGAVTFGGVNDQGRQLIQPFNSGVRPDIAEDKMARQANTVNDAFLLTLFQILVETPQMTATEVMARMQEKGSLVAPVLGRLQSEYLGPMIEREIDLLVAMGQLPEMPPALVEAQGEFEIQYESPISRLQRSEEMVGANRVLEATMMLVNAGDEQALDRFDGDVYIKLTQELNGAPTKLLRSDDDVAAIRQQRAQAMQEQHNAEVAQQQSQAAANMGQAEASMAQAERVQQ
jgi:hypothetical protein